MAQSSALYRCYASKPLAYVINKEMERDRRCNNVSIVADTLVYRLFNLLHAYTYKAYMY